MKVVDAGHEYELDSLDGEQINKLVFVKREGKKYPGNVGHHPGTTMQEVLRALIDRAKYVNSQVPDINTISAIDCMRKAIFSLESRAAIRHNRTINFSIDDAVNGKEKCLKCGHVGCNYDCLKGKNNDN